MAYVPPHKRHLNTGDATSSKPLPALPPSFKVTRFQKNKEYRNPKLTSIVFSKDFIEKWFVVGLHEIDDDDEISTFTKLELVATDSIKRKSFGLFLKENYEEVTRREVLANPWEFIAETVKDDFVVSLQKVRDVIMSSEAGGIKSYALVRFGKVLFKELLSGVECYTKGTLESSRGSFYTNLTSSYMQIINDVAPRIGLDHSEEKDVYLIVLSDNMQPGSTISCKCDVNKDANRLQFRKFVVNPVRHFVADVTCLEKNIDLRLSLLSKKNSYTVTEEQLDKIKDLISCAIFDEKIKGGLRWPLGKVSLKRHNVVGVWHVTSRTFENSIMKLKARMVDRYDYRTSEGEIAREVFLNMKNIVSKLGEDRLDTEIAFEMLKENLEVIWKQVIL